MKKIISSGIIGCFALMSFATDLHGMEASGILITGTSNTTVDIGEIKDPYEQCLAYVKLKKIEGTDCKKIADSIKQKTQINNNRGTAILDESPKKPDPKPTNPPTWTPSTGIENKLTKPIKIVPLPERLPPIKQCLMAGPGCDGTGVFATGALQSDIKWLLRAIEKLSPQEKLELAKIIRSYLESKKIKVPSIDLYIPRKDEIKNAIDTKKQEILVIKDEKMDAIRMKQEAIRAQFKAEPDELQKNYTGHVTLMKQ